MRHVVMTVMAILLAGGGNIEGVGGDISNRGPNKIRLTLPTDWVDNLRGLQGQYVMCGGSEGALTLKTLLREGGVTFVEKRALGDNVIDCTSPLHIAWDERQSRGDSGTSSWQEEGDRVEEVRVEEDRRERRNEGAGGYYRSNINYGGHRAGARTGLGVEEAANYTEAVDVATLIVSVLTGCITSLVGWTLRNCIYGGGCGCLGRGGLRLRLPNVKPAERRFSTASLSQERGQVGPRGVRRPRDEQEYIDAGQGGNVEAIERIGDPEQPAMPEVRSTNNDSNYGRHVLVPKRSRRQ